MNELIKLVWSIVVINDFNKIFFKFLVLSNLHQVGNMQLKIFKLWKITP